MASKSFTRLVNGAALSFGKRFLKDVERSKSHAPELQHALFNHLISCGKETKYGAENTSPQLRLLKISEGEFPFAATTILFPT